MPRIAVPLLAGLILLSPVTATEPTPAVKLRYRGRIDDQFGVGYKRNEPTRKDLELALQEVLAGKPVSVADTPVAGCLIARTVTPKTEGAITYTKQVSRILQQHCQECHRP